MWTIQQLEGQRSAFSVPRRPFVRPIRDVGPVREVVVRHEARNEYGSVAVSARKCARRPKALNLDHCQIVEATLIRAEAIGRTEPHAEVAMKDQAERFPTVVTSHAFNMRQRSSLALHLRSPFPRLRKTNAKTSGGFPTTPAFAGGSQNVRGRLRLPLGSDGCSDNASASHLPRPQARLVCSRAT